MANTDDLYIFRDDAIMYETVGGVSIDQQSGEWSFHEFESTDKFLKDFGQYEGAVEAFGNMVRKNKATVSETEGQVSVTEDDSDAGFDETGTIKTKQFTCPQCGKKVDQLNKNGYCSKACAAKARAVRAQASVSAAGEKTLETIAMVKEKLAMLDAALNLLNALPDIIKMKAKLPEVYREYITLRIDYIFIKMKMMVNLLMIQKNELLMQVLRKLKTGALDKTMMKIFQPIQTVMQVVIQVQIALNTAVQAVMAMLQDPMTGLEPQSYGFFMTAKSMQVGQYAGKMIIPIEPQANIALSMKSAMNCIPYEKIDEIVKKALPPIQEVEYFMPPELFKVRFALSQDNGPRVKKAWEILEALMKFSAECFPRYKDLKLSNPWFVLAILTGWGPVSQKVFGDFIFHGSI